MTEEQKDILIFKMLDTPTSLTDEEVAAIKQDGELRDIYEMSAAVCSACAGKHEINMAEEWERFRPRLRRKPASLRWIMRVAAIFLGVVIISGIVGRLIDKTLMPEKHDAIAKIENTSVAKEVTECETDTPYCNLEEEIADKPKEDKIQASAQRQRIAGRQTVNTVSSKEAPGQDIDVEEYLRIQEAMVDNDLAIQVAEEYREELDYIEELREALGIANPEFSAYINSVTTQ